MSKMKLKKNFLIQHRLKRAVQKGIILLSFLVSVTTSSGKISAHEIDQFASLNTKTKAKIIQVQKENKDQYTTIFNQVKKAEEFIKLIYETEEIDEKLVRKYIAQTDQLIKYFKSMKNAGFKFTRLIDGLRESKKLIVSSILDELNSTVRLAFSECRLSAYDKADEWNKAGHGHGQSEAFYGAKKSIVSNANFIKAKEMIILLKSLKVEDSILVNAELIISKIEKSLTSNSTSGISDILNK